MTSSEKPWYTPVLCDFLAKDVPRLLGLPPAAFARDVTTLEQRLACEGESFLTKTLPALGKDIDRALQGHVPLVSTSFKKRGRTALPAFLSALHRRVFLDTGWVRDEPCITAIRLLRQIAYWCKKVEKGYSDESLQKAVADFKEVDASLPDPGADIALGFLGIARSIVERLFRDIEDISKASPRHGPGSVAGCENAVEKRRLAHSFTRLERVFRPIPWFRSLRDCAENPQAVLGRPVTEYGLSRTQFVEKDSGGPRTIGLEQAEYMWCQQALKDLMYRHIESRSFARGHVNFTDQTINRDLARDWSTWETLDMSKASDRNSLSLVRTLFRNTRIWPALEASRSPGTVLPSGEILWFKKFAPMGSAVCFPVQACVYYALACTALHLSGMPLSLTFRHVYVYGDDLIVPRGYFPKLNEVFEAVGLKFNADKCCIHGRFRESCGLDAFDGEEVTPIRLRKTSSRRGVTALSSLVEHANHLHARGYRASSSRLRELISVRFRKYRIPVTMRTDLPILAFHDEWEDTVRYRHRDGITQVQGWVFEPDRLKASEDVEVTFLRESLSTGGPVGVLKCRPGAVQRELMKRYAGKYRKRWLPVLRTSSVQSFPAT